LLLNRSALVARDPIFREICSFSDTVLLSSTEMAGLPPERRCGYAGVPMFGNRNLLFLIIGALIVVAGVLGYNLYQDRKQPEGLQINVGPNGVKIQGK
jgi:hypothetical protein